MRFAFVPFVILAVSFTLAAAHSATIEPTASADKIDITRLPPPETPVFV